VAKWHAPQDAAFLRSCPKEELVRTAMRDANNWLAHDGLWFEAVEERHGMAAAIEPDRGCLSALHGDRADRLMERLGTPGR